MPGKRQGQPATQKIASAFVRELQKTSGDLIHRLAIDQRVPLREIYEGHVYATFQMLEMTLRARHMAEGKLPPAPTAAPLVKIRERELLMHDIMDLVGEELATIDGRHDYSVVILKRERRGPQGGQFPL